MRTTSEKHGDVTVDYEVSKNDIPVQVYTIITSKDGNNVTRIDYSTNDVVTSRTETITTFKGDHGDYDVTTTVYNADGTQAASYKTSYHVGTPNKVNGTNTEKLVITDNSQVQWQQETITSGDIVTVNWRDANGKLLNQTIVNATTFHVEIYLYAADGTTKTLLYSADVSTKDGITTTTIKDGNGKVIQIIQENPIDEATGLSAAAIAGIVIAVIALGALIFFGIRYQQRKKKGDNYQRAK